ncbi:MAG: polysaccharide deacetylase [Lachnospiraceae bacterium]|nr:polysaccharide deacetylase [Lachnospiraceae bacterium]
MDEREKAARVRETRAKAAQRRRKQIMRIRIAILAVLIVALVILLVLIGKLRKQNKPAEEPTVAASQIELDHTGDGQGAVIAPEGGETATETVEEVPAAGSRDAIVAEAKAKAVQYDYQGAMDLLNTVENGQTDSEVTRLMGEYQNAMASLVATPPTLVTHVFFHSLVIDPARGFSLNDTPGWNNGTEGFCEWMTTDVEFNRMMEQMYERGYVLISLYDMVDEQMGEDGLVHMIPKDILLPEGKIPFVLSLDDLSYYHSYDGRGCATKMIVGEDGKPTCEYVDENGNTQIGSYDCVPLLDDFLETHPDFSYKGAKGTIALTGYNGILGYRTDYCYRDRVELTADQEAWLAIHPEYNWETECAKAREVADAIKADGWTFASHTWGHMHIGDADMSRVQADTEKWLEFVAPLIGGSDIIIFAHGQDLANWNEEYSSTEKFQYMKAHGFNIFCNVDSSKYFVEFGDLYMRQGRRNLDGYRLWQSVFNPGDGDKTEDLYDANSVWDERRPTNPELYDLM